MAGRALYFKEEGNKCFRAGDYKAAEGFYTQAIVADPSNHQLFTNRAFARIKLNAWEDVISDCLKSIELSHNMKAYYYLSQAQLHLHHPNEAHSSALTAYELCVQNNDPSVGSISALVLRAKKEKWEIRERDRVRRRNELLAELEDRLEIARSDEREAIEDNFRRGLMPWHEAEEEIAIVDQLSRQKHEELRSIFAIADPEHAQQRQVPDYLIDNISFSVMHDPVVTKTGQSYERSTILEHLRRSETDPLTREPLSKEDLRPNFALKQACEAFLEENGWAVDW
ncbi:MAG: hypothetical protein M1817_006307 [Caeruleum heppii]|nr:MAG: hypothetical protein M1817_006307 [Caeruleum heppii]